MSQVLALAQLEESVPCRPPVAGSLVDEHVFESRLEYLLPSLGNLIHRYLPGAAVARGGMSVRSPYISFPRAPVIVAVRLTMGPLHGTFFLDVISVVLIDVLLAGDNAVLIAMAVKSLPPAQRRMGIAAGAGGAVVLRIILTFFAFRLLQLSYLKVAGGVLILWIAVKLLSEGSEDTEDGRRGHSLRQAIWLILVADLTMSIDNILAVAAASKGNLPILILGLGLSITFVVFSSGLISGLMDRFPLVIWIGAGILGRVGAEMVVSDPWIISKLHPSEWLNIAVQVVGGAGVLLAGWALKNHKAKKTKNSLPENV